MENFVVNLKVGDEVAYGRTYGFNGTIMNLSFVEKITPTGRVVLGNGMKFDKYGTEMGQKHHSSYLRSIEDYQAWKAQNEEKAAKRDLIAKIENFKLETYSNEDLNKILEILKTAQ